MLPIARDPDKVEGFDPDRPPLRHVRERDIRLMLPEEIRSTPEFRSELFQQLGTAELEQGDFVGAYHSVRNSLGQSDLVVDFLVKKKKWRVYIENKIDADFQPEQAERYDGHNWIRRSGFVTPI